MNIDYIFTAVFDPDQGPVLQYQFPQTSHYDFRFLAEIMLPDRIHERNEDWLQFFLHFREDIQAYSLFPSVTKAIKGPNGSEVYHVLNVIRTKRERLAKRNGSLSAMAICTSFPHVQALKPLLDTAWSSFDASPSSLTLEHVFKKLCSHDFHSFFLDVSLDSSVILTLNDFHPYVEFQTQKSEIGTNSYSPPLLDSGVSLKIPPTKFLLSTSADNTPDITTCAVPTVFLPECVGEYSISNLIQTFINSPFPLSKYTSSLPAGVGDTNPIIVLINSLILQKRVLFLTSKLPAHVLTSFVLSACALASGASGLLQGYLNMTFPYVDLSNVDQLLKLPGYIAGAMNPTFLYHQNWWDLLCDLDNQIIHVSPELTKKKMSSKVLELVAAVPYNQLSPSRKLKGHSEQYLISDLHELLTHSNKELLVRWKIRTYLLSFIRKAISYEHLFLESSSLNPHVENYKLEGFGWFWPDRTARANELSLMAGKIEEWRKTKSYENYCHRMANTYIPVMLCMDIAYHLDRLRFQVVSSEDAACIYSALEQYITTDEDITYLLSLCPLHEGGLTIIAYGLYHISNSARQKVIQLLDKIKQHKYGEMFFACLPEVDKMIYASLRFHSN
ncbi:cytoskeletal protein [Schizosaccharomyces cryophilus OY26]|uniref:Cytoskeletal protein n=1 Tax=Schizosaccharomyces cryophilus (strain OY26 / ATCC MYA-4695 / CBS 11777 / NBRC 106824 / NRRL Y48691) TaxID=653667 RepID=S9W8B6_SCHCR|nr:cytoskeletal protein [Schizosaccharomyces cryophilus OY26]EPY54025.1 cytoskeletal protein [Schizosaccharomyces cryophilus OY26]